MFIVESELSGRSVDDPLEIRRQSVFTVVSDSITQLLSELVTDSVTQ